MGWLFDVGPIIQIGRGFRFETSQDSVHPIKKILPQSPANIKPRSHQHQLKNLESEFHHGVFLFTPFDLFPPQKKQTKTLDEPNLPPSNQTKPPNQPPPATKPLPSSHHGNPTNPQQLPNNLPFHLSKVSGFNSHLFPLQGSGSCG